MAQYSLSNIMEYIIEYQWQHTFVVPEVLAIMIKQNLLAQINSILNGTNYKAAMLKVWRRAK